MSILGTRKRPNLTNASLLKANQHLQDVVRRLEERIYQLQQELDTTRTRPVNTEKQEAHHIARMVQHSEIDIPAKRLSLPPPQVHAIALRCIFDYLVPPPGILEYSLSYGARSGWCCMIRTLKSVALVCTSWHEAVLPLLYRDVVLRRVGQVAAFARTICSSPETFVAHVRSLTICCMVPDRWVSVTRRFLERIVEGCTRLDTLSFQGTFPLTEMFELEDTVQSESSTRSENNSALVSILHRVSSLHLFDRGYYGPIPDFQYFPLPEGVCANLTSLSVFVDDTLGISLVQLPNLDTLVLYTPFAYHGSSYYLPQSWDLPKLKSLRFRLERNNQTNSVSVFDFCTKYSSSLSNLDFALSQGQISLQSQTSAAALCSNLEHLVLAVGPPFDSRMKDSIYRLRNSQIFSQDIRLVDIVIKQDTPHRKRFRHSLDRNGCAWTHVRYLDEHLLSHISELPYLFPELSMADGRPRVMDFYGFNIIETDGWLDFREVGWSCLACTSEMRHLDNDDEDDEYTASSDSEDDSGGSQVSVVRYPDQNDIEDGQGDVTEEEALAIFSSTLDQDYYY